MSNKHLKIVNAVLLHLGIILTLEGDMSWIKSSMLGSAIANGITDTYTSTVEIAEQHGSAANWHLGIGITLILLGYAMHAWMTQREERPVKVHVKKTKKKSTMFWMRVRV